MEPDEGAARVTLSKILDWYGADFGADEAAVLGLLRVPASGLGLGHPTPTPTATPNPNPNPNQVLGRLQGFLPEESAQHTALAEALRRPAAELQVTYREYDWGGNDATPDEQLG